MADDDESKVAQPAKGDFIAPPELIEADEPGDALPPQEEFWRPPVRFGSVPVEKEPLGWDRRRGFRKLFPQVALPFQVVERVSFGHPKMEPNRLFWGDNLHVMRQLPSESVDLIYIDPPFFSGRQNNTIFGDKNELRSFSDIWQGGMPGYLVWLNARLYEMKRLLKKTGSIYVHLDWHAVHYAKVEMRYKQDNLRDGIMLAWAFRPDAVEAADRLRRLEQTDLNFIRLEQIRIDSPRFREHVSALTTDHADYENFLTFVQTPRVEVGRKRVASRTYKFDASDTIVMNAGAKIINVQWDFDYNGRFTSTSGFSFIRGGDKEPILQADYTFPSSGKKQVACKVQDDMGGEGLWTAEIDVN